MCGINFQLLVRILVMHEWYILHHECICGIFHVHDFYPDSVAVATCQVQLQSGFLDAIHKAREITSDRLANKLLDRAMHYQLMINAHINVCIYLIKYMSCRYIVCIHTYMYIYIYIYIYIYTHTRTYIHPYIYI